MESRSWPRDLSSREGKRRVGRASAAQLKNPLFVGEGAGCLRGLAMETYPLPFASRSGGRGVWRGPYRAPRAGRLGPLWVWDEAARDPAGRLPLGGVGSGTDKSLPCTTLTRPAEGARTKPHPLWTISRLRSGGMGPRPTNALDSARVALLEIAAARRPKASTRTPGSELC